MILRKLKEILITQLGIEEDSIALDSRLVEDLGADSLDVTELILAVEDEFDIEIDESRLENMVTVGDIVNYIKEQSDLDIE